MRWLNVEKTSKGDDHQLTVFSSCLRPLYENGGKKTVNVDKADEGNDVIVLSYPVIERFLEADINNVRIIPFYYRFVAISAEIFLMIYKVDIKLMLRR